MPFEGTPGAARSAPLGRVDSRRTPTYPCARIAGQPQQLVRVPESPPDSEFQPFPSRMHMRGRRGVATTYTMTPECS